MIRVPFFLLFWVLIREPKLGNLVIKIPLVSASIFLRKRSVRSWGGAW